MHFAEDDRPEITSVLRNLTLASRQEPGCVSYIAHWVEGEPATVFIYEQYQDEAAVEFHKSTEHFAQYATAGLYQRMLDRRIEYLQAIA